MPEVVMYCTARCGYCRFADALLSAKGIAATKIWVDREPERFEEMVERSRRRTVPQIFIGERHVGGYTDLAALESAGELDGLLAGDGV